MCRSIEEVSILCSALSLLQAMSQGVHLISSNIPGYGKSKERCVPCHKASGMGAVSFYTYYDRFKPFPPANDVPVKNSVNVSKKTSIVCSANFGNQKTNSDFSRQNRQHSSYIRNRNRQNTERENFRDLEESELLSSKNGSLSGSVPYQQIAVPGEREQEILKLFRKVQAQLRQRKTKKVEAASQGTGKESDTINALLKLLEKQSEDKGKRRSDGSFSSGDDLVLDQQEQKKPFDEEQNAIFEANDRAREEAQEPNTSAFRRPPSNFRRRSPVPRVKYQPVISVQKGLNSVPASESKVTRKAIIDEPEDELEPEPELELELDPEPKSVAETEPDIEPYSTSADMYDQYDNEVSESESSDPDEDYSDKIVETPSSTDNTDLSALKVADLRVLAKSRGLKGFSRMKKGELVELLAGGFKLMK